MRTHITCMYVYIRNGTLIYCIREFVMPYNMMQTQTQTQHHPHSHSPIKNINFKNSLGQFYQIGAGRRGPSWRQARRGAARRLQTTRRPSTTTTSGQLKLRQVALFISKTDRGFEEHFRSATASRALRKGKTQTQARARVDERKIGRKNRYPLASWQQREWRNQRATLPPFLPFSHLSSSAIYIKASYAGSVGVSFLTTDTKSVDTRLENG